MNSTNAPKVRYHILTQLLEAMCKSSGAMLELLKKEEQHYRNVIENIMKDDLYTRVPELIPAKRKGRAFAAMISALSGMIMLAVQNVNSYL